MTAGPSGSRGKAGNQDDGSNEPKQSGKVQQVKEMIEARLSSQSSTPNSTPWDSRISSPRQSQGAVSAAPSSPQLEHDPLPTRSFPKLSSEKTPEAESPPEADVPFILEGVDERPSSSEIATAGATSTQSHSQHQELEYWEDDFKTPRTTDQPSRASSMSSTKGGALNVPRRHSGSAPPSARRGVSSIYSQATQFTPIPEEAYDVPVPQIPKTSFASSHAIPQGWPPSPTRTTSSGRDESEYGDNVRREHGQDDDNTTLVRKASLGRKHKASLTTIKSSEKIRETYFGVKEKEERPKEPEVRPVEQSPEPDRAGGLVSKLARASLAAASVKRLSGRFDRQTLWPTVDRAVQASASKPQERPAEIRTTRGISIATNNKPSNDVPQRNTRFGEIVNGLEKAGITDAAQTLRPSPARKGTIHENNPSSRKPRLVIDVSKTSKGHVPQASVTSLPDLIRRATRLAAVLDRRANQKSVAEYSPTSQNADFEKEYSRNKSGDISDILAAFPPPALGSPNTNWPAFSGPDGAGAKSIRGIKRVARRKCCGVPLWVFLLLVTALIILLVLAVVLPVIFLVVLPREKGTSAFGTPDSVQACMNDVSCSNGGTNFYTTGFCGCICVNGFTGDRCTVPADEGCAFVELENNGQTIDNATVGNALPGVLQTAATNFSILLNSSQLISIFNSQNLSCTSENALVSFDNNDSSTRRSLPLEDIIHDNVSTGNELHKELDIHVQLRQRSNPSTTSSLGSATAITVSATSMPAPVTSDGIIFEPSATPSSTASSPSSPSSAASLDMAVSFAQTSVLYIFQEKGLQDALNAQQSLASYLEQGTAVLQQTNLTVQNGITVDFVNFSIDLGNGTAVVGSSG